MALKNDVCIRVTEDGAGPKVGDQCWRVFGGGGWLTWLAWMELQQQTKRENLQGSAVQKFSGSAVQRDSPAVAAPLFKHTDH